MSSWWSKFDVKAQVLWEWGRNGEIVLAYIFFKNALISINPRPWWPSFHSAHTVQYNVAVKTFAYFLIQLGDSVQSGSIQMCLIGGCLVCTQPCPITVLSVCKTLCSQQLWATLSQMIYQVKQLDGTRTVDCISVNGPTVWNNLNGSVVLDSSLAGFECTTAPVHSQQ